jgi:hypothetical protein
MLHSKVGARTRREFASPIPQASFDRIEPVVERGSVSISDCGRLRERRRGSDFRLQAVQTFENLKNALAAVRGQFRSTTISST